VSVACDVEFVGCDECFVSIVLDKFCAQICVRSV
jgi:hypothetical protein